MNPNWDIIAAIIFLSALVLFATYHLGKHAGTYQGRYECLKEHEPHVQRLQDEVFDWRQAARWILSQRGDDICWRDFYVKLAKLLPEEPDVSHLLLPPREQFLKNCANFEACLRRGDPTSYKPGP